MKKAVLIALLVILASSIVVFAQYQQTAPFYYPTSFVKPYPSMCNMVKPVRESPNCLIEGLVSCAGINTGNCFTQCAQFVKVSCFDRLSNAPTCELEAKFFIKYPDRQSCNKAVYKLCDERCLSSANNDFNSFNYETGFAARKKCITHGIEKCSQIGRTLV